ncbi:MAG: hypothetical protein WBD20_05215 [Pirellulaceae bacterium]
MDDLTEPLIAVIGDPIAGNPSQLAIELALKSLGLEYHVNSFQVSSDNVVAALDGLQVLGYRGVLVDDSLALLAAAWSEGQSSEGYGGSPINCLYRKLEDEERLYASDTHGQWLTAQANEHFKQLETTIEKCLWLGNRNKKFPADLVDVNKTELSTRTPSVDSVVQADLIVLSSGPKGEVPLDINEWPADDGSTLIIDLTDGNEEICNAADKGYKVISSLDRQIGTIAQSFQLWTGAQPSTTIIREAIEEYLSV